MDKSIAISESSAFAEGGSGLRVFYRCWRPGIAPRATLTIVPGFNSHSGYYAWAGRELAARGIVVRSPSSRGVAEEAPGAYKDVAAVVEASESAGLARRVARLEPLLCVKG